MTSKTKTTPITKGSLVYLRTAREGDSTFGERFTVKSVRVNVSHGREPLVALLGYHRGMVPRSSLISVEDVDSVLEGTFEAARKQRVAQVSAARRKQDEAMAFERDLRSLHQERLEAPAVQLGPVTIEMQRDGRYGRVGATLRSYRIAGRGLQAELATSDTFIGVDLMPSFRAASQGNDHVEWGISLSGFVRTVQQAELTQAALAMAIDYVRCTPAPSR